MKKYVALVSLVFIFLTAVQELPAQASNKNKQQAIATSGLQDRAFWVKTLYKIADPVVHNLAEGTLKKNMPLELGPDYYLQATKVTYLEAVGRTMAGIAPWLALPDDETAEGKMRKQLRDELLRGLANAVDPNHADYLNFRTEGQPLVDAAFVALPIWPTFILSIIFYETYSLDQFGFVCVDIFFVNIICAK